jgi:hypothetical protein
MNKLAFGLRSAYSKPCHDSISFVNIFSLSLSAFTDYKNYENEKTIKIGQFFLRRGTVYST